MAFDAVFNCFIKSSRKAALAASAAFCGGYIINALSEFTNAIMNLKIMLKI